MNTSKVFLCVTSAVLCALCGEFTREAFTQSVQIASDFMQDLGTIKLQKAIFAPRVVALAFTAAADEGELSQSLTSAFV